VLALTVVACGDPRLGAPADEQRVRDRALASDLARHIEVIPGVERVSAWVRHPVRDPLAPDTLAFRGADAGSDRDDDPAARAAASIAVVTRAGVSPSTIATQARTLAVAALGDVRADDVEVMIVAALPPPPELVDLGPFRVERGSRTGLVITLAAALVLIAGLASWIVVIDLRSRRRQRGAASPRH